MYNLSSAYFYITTNRSINCDARTHLERRESFLTYYTHDFTSYIRLHPPSSRHVSHVICYSWPRKLNRLGSKASLCVVKTNWDEMDCSRGNWAKHMCAMWVGKSFVDFVVRCWNIEPFGICICDVMMFLRRSFDALQVYLSSITLFMWLQYAKCCAV